jgi:hypothetical protein
MKNKLFALILLSCLAGTISGQDAVSNADLARKLDLILLKVDSLEKRVDAIEGKAGSLPTATATARPIAPQPAVRAHQPAPAPAPRVIPQDPQEKKSFFQKIRNELKSDAVLGSGPWTTPETWANIRRGISDFEVRRILGNPTKIKNSINPRIDRIYRYEGDLDGDGVEEKGVVNFQRGRVVSFEPPFQIK